MGFWNKLKENPRLAARICWTINLFCFALGAAGLLIDLKILFLAAILLLIVFADLAHADRTKEKDLLYRKPAGH